jgi:hypothetical protein
MKQNYLQMRSFHKKFLATIVIALCMVSSVFSQTYVNGNLGTSATSNNGTAAPAGTMWHELQHVSPTESNSTLGLGHVFLGASDFGLADDFTIPAGPSWNITTIRVYSLDQVTTGTTSPYNNIRVRIWNGVPGAGGTVVWGDMTTNVFAGTAYTNKRGIFNSLGSTAAPTPNLPIFSIDANVNTTLAPGTYWIEWQVVNAAACFSPTSQVIGIRSMPSYNARQRTIAAWAAAIDGGSPTTAPDVNIELPFSVNYNTGACTGTPAPGNTIASATAVCALSPVNLSLQNATVGSGVTYQWFSGPSATGPWTPIAGATNPAYTITNLPATTFYQATVTCSGNTGTSTPVQITLNPASACYCIPTPGSDCTDDDVIEIVNVGGLIKTSACSAGGYSNYTTTDTANLIVGAANPISVTTGDSWTEQVGVWVDYDRSGSFEASEFTNLGSTAAASGGVHNGSIAVPAGVATGYTRMRVRVRFSTALAGGNACLSYLYGETEDYTVNLVPCVPVSVTTSPANASVSCGANATFSIALGGSIPAAYWQYKTSAASTNWLNVPNAAPYSGVNTTTLTITGATAALNGYQYRAVYSGACTGASFSSAATLTVTALTPVVTPSSAAICNGSVQQLSLTNTLGNTAAWTEGFNGTIPPTGWVTQNNSSPLGTTGWFAGSAATFPSFSGAGYIAANYENTDPVGSGTISNWLISPVQNLKNGDLITFYSRIPAGTEYPDRLEVRLSSAGTSSNVGATATSVGDFSTLLLSINPTLVTGVYPKVWTQFTATVSGLAAPTSGKIAFRYFVTDGGGNAANSNYIGIDDVSYIVTGAIAQGTWGGPAGTIFTDAGATTAYTGTPATTVYVKPTVNGVNNYTVSFATALCQSSTATIPVTVRQLPSAIAAVANSVICQGGNTSFTTTFTGGSGLTGQWQVSSDNGATYTNITDGGVYSGANTVTLNITGAGTNLNNNRYRLVIAAAPCVGTVASTAGILTVNALPVLNLTANPYTAIYPGQTTTLAVASTTTVPANGYTWYRNGVVVPGATTNTLVVDVDGLGDYTVSVADANGCGNAQPASITITSAPNDIMFIYPSPNTGLFQVRYYSAAGNNPLPRTINIYDSKGARVYSKSYSVAVPYTRMDVDMTTFQKGIYQVELTDRSGNRLKTGRVLIL